MAKRWIQLAVLALSIQATGCATLRGGLPRFEDAEHRQFAKRFKADYRRYRVDPEGFFRPQPQVDCAPSPELVAQLTDVTAANAAVAGHGMETSIHDADVEIIRAECVDGVARDGDVLYRAGYVQTSTLQRQRTRASTRYELVADAVLRDGKAWRSRASYMRMGGMSSETRLKSGKKVVDRVDPAQAEQYRKTTFVTFSYASPDVDPAEPGSVTVSFAPMPKEHGGLHAFVVRVLPDGGQQTTRWTRGRKTSISRMDRDGKLHGKQVNYERPAGQSLFGPPVDCYRHGEPIKTLDCNVD